ncbi:tetratricopeptide repeat protein [Flavobacterium soli]|uniref:tetratricopeptide repeat protein n=1 Tax=Flavobacterium soli TaxID=344881 RepID=UPI00041D3AAA|nr:hypothetical protein [Flavobacterium soli]
MKLTYWFLLLLFFISFESMGQKGLSNFQIDSLLKTDSLSIYNNPEKSYALAKKIYWASEKNKYNLGLAMSLYKISLYHSEILNDYKKSLAYNDKGYEFAQKINNDSLLLFYTFSKGTLYGKLGFHEKSLRIFDDCLQQTKSIKNLKRRSLFRGDLYTYKAVSLSHSQPHPSNKVLLDIYIKAMNEYEKALDKCVNPGYTNVGVYYFHLKNYEKADYYLKKAAAFFKLKNLVSCEIEYTNLGDLNYETGHYETAFQYLDSSNTICFEKPRDNYYLISKNYETYKNIYTQLGDKDSIIKYQKLEMAYNDSLAFDKENRRRESVSYIMAKNENDNKKLEKNTRRIILFSVLTILVTGVLLTIYYRRSNKTLKGKNLLKEKELEEDLEKRAVQIQQLKQKVSSSYDELIVMAKKDNPLFVSFFKELYPDFYRKLKEIQPGLTILEQKVCFYLKLKFSTREIADCTFVSVKAIQTRKNRLRKRLFIEDGKDIYDWIDELD